MKYFQVQGSSSILACGLENIYRFPKLTTLHWNLIISSVELSLPSTNMYIYFTGYTIKFDSFITTHLRTNTSMG